MSTLYSLLGSAGAMVFESVPENALVVVLMAIAVLLGAGDVRLHRSGLAGVSATFDAVALVVVGPTWSIALVVVGILAGIGFGDNARGAGVRLLAARVSGVVLGYSAAVLAVMSSSMPLGAVRVAAMVVSFFVAMGVYLTLAGDGGAALSTHMRGRGLEDQTSMAMALLSAGCLSLTVFETMGVWSLLLLCVLLLLVRQSYSLLAEISDSYLRTVEVLVEAAEGIGSSMRGHAERSAALARSLALKAGLSRAGVRCAGYAALLHAVGAIGDVGERDRSGPSAARVVETIEYFSPVIGPLRVLDDQDVPGAVSELDVAIALCVALAQERDRRLVFRSGGGQSLMSEVRRIAAMADSDTLRRVATAATALGYDNLGALS